MKKNSDNSRLLILFLEYVIIWIIYLIVVLTKNTLEGMEWTIPTFTILGNFARMVLIPVL